MPRNRIQFNAIAWSCYQYSESPVNQVRRRWRSSVPAALHNEHIFFGDTPDAIGFCQSRKYQPTAFFLSVWNGNNLPILCLYRSGTEKRCCFCFHGYRQHRLLFSMGEAWSPNRAGFLQCQCRTIIASCNARLDLAEKEHKSHQFIFGEDQRGMGRGGGLSPCSHSSSGDNSIQYHCLFLFFVHQIARDWVIAGISIFMCNLPGKWSARGFFQASDWLFS